MLQNSKNLDKSGFQSQQLSRQPQAVQRKCACSGRSAEPQCGHSSKVAKRFVHCASVGADSRADGTSFDTFTLWTLAPSRAVMDTLTGFSAQLT